jgi:hypothetical protein
MNRVTRNTYASALTTVTRGIRLKGYTKDTLSVVNLCAQFVRQTVESIEGLTPGTWEVAGLALDVARERKRPGDRYAVDYEEAGRRLGLSKSFKEITPGDIGYWVYSIYGHTAICVELENKLYWLENTNAVTRAGGRRVFPSVTDKDGEKVPGKVWLTPLDVLGTPRTIITPSKNIQQQRPIAREARDDGIALLEHNIGDRVFIIKNDAQQEVGTLEKSTLINGKIYIKVK